MTGYHLGKLRRKRSCCIDMYPTQLECCNQTLDTRIPTVEMMANAGLAGIDEVISDDSTVFTDA